MQYEIGRVSLLGNRKNNQDRLGSVDSHGGVVLILGDGLGGKPGGELAAETLVKSVEYSMRHIVMPVENPESFLRKLIIRANKDIKSAGQKKDPPLTPGTTVVLCLIQNKKAWWAHVGDSRLYFFRDGLPIYRTQDDSYVEELYQKGEISLEKRDGHPMRNYVTQCIGLMGDDMKITISKGVNLQVGDTILLCSDGFWEPLDDAQIGANLAELSIKEAVNKLASRAEQISYPKSDNTTAIALKVISLQDLKKEKQTGTTSKQPADTPLDGAIQDIEEVLNLYKDEMDD